MKATKPQSEIERTCFNLFKPPPDISIVEWAEKNRVLSPENCALPGPYRVAVTPYLKEILEAATDPDVDKLVCQKSAQVAWTDGFINNVIGYYIDCDPSPMMAMFPTDKMSERYSKEKLKPMIRDCRVLQEKIADDKSRDSGNTLSSKNFPGGHLELVGSNSPANLAASPIRIVIVEEPDRCARNAGKEGNSLKVIYERTKTFFNRKILVGGSPTIKGASSIETEMALSDYRKLHIPCPHCDHKQTLEWKMVVWEKNKKLDHEVFGQHDPKTARLKCKKCKKLFDNSQKIKQLAKGKWIPTKPFNGTRGYFINELYSPFPKARLQDVVEKFLEANQALKRGDNTLMIVWTNTALGDTWEEKGERPDWTIIKERAEPYSLMTVPMGGMVLTMGVDTHKNRLAVVVKATGRDRESWRIFHKELIGDPNQPEVWQQLTDILKMSWPHESGVKLKIVSTAIDSGGNRTSAVYNYVRSAPSSVIAIKGHSISGKPALGKPTWVDVTWDGETDKDGVQLWMVGTDTIKSKLFGSLKIEIEGPGYFHTSDELSDDYYKQLTAEKLVTKYKFGNPYQIYENTGRNEVTDCEVYAEAAAVRVGIETLDWDRIEAQIRAHVNSDVGKQKIKSPVRKTGTISEVKL